MKSQRGNKGEKETERRRRDVSPAAGLVAALRTGLCTLWRGGGERKRPDSMTEDGQFASHWAKTGPPGEREMERRHKSHT